MPAYNVIEASDRTAPPGPAAACRTDEDLLSWMASHFAVFGDIYHSTIYGSNSYITREPKHAQHILVTNWKNYTKGHIIKRIGLLLGDGLMVSEGAHWKRQRQMIQPAFHRNAVASLSQMITETNFMLLQKWLDAAKAGATVNVTRDVSCMVSEITLKAIFGDGADYHWVAPHFAVLLEDPERNLQFAQTFRGLRNVLKDLLVRRRTEGVVATDILGVLMAARDRDTGQPMPEPQLLNEILTLIVAGHETTASTLSWVWYLLSQDDVADRRLEGELSMWRAELPQVEQLRSFVYTHSVIEETLRLFPPGWLITRKALKDDWLGEYLVPAGTEIFLPLYFIHRHPRLWERPDQFNPERFVAEQTPSKSPVGMLPFSAGPRNCIGEALARLEMKIHLMVIGKRLRLRLVSTDPVMLNAGVNLRSRHDFIMLPELRRGVA